VIALSDGNSQPGNRCEFGPGFDALSGQDGPDLPREPDLRLDEFLPEGILVKTRSQTPV
jgi:hypothetical protein